ncbi:hypothetical protein [Shewanella psychrophila]|uniref:hypothetical protein n=1 Tax=Shewanella psychrophila TaxID=225848 RepID=UPI0011EA5516|nr:hypothetical protein [Shewanella psychrophila]
MYSRRLAEASSYKVTHSHPGDRDIRKSIYSTTAGDSNRSTNNPNYDNTSPMKPKALAVITPQ